VTSEAADIEALLRQAFAPVEPGDEFSERVERTLVNITALATEELESWELSAMRDPRNWVRPAVALTAGGLAAGALALAGMRRREHHRRQASRQWRNAVEKAARAAAQDVQRLFED
jgi:hypothetical protein